MPQSHLTADSIRRTFIEFFKDKPVAWMGWGAAAAL